MSERPVLDSKTFRDFYYLKEELVNFCKENGISVSGGKIEITDRIACSLNLKMYHKEHILIHYVMMVGYDEELESDIPYRANYDRLRKKYRKYCYAHCTILL